MLYGTINKCHEAIVQLHCNMETEGLKDLLDFASKSQKSQPVVLDKETQIRIQNNWQKHELRAQLTYLSLPEDLERKYLHLCISCEMDLPVP